MRPFITALFLLTISAEAAADRTLPFRHARTPQSHQELATAVRSILALPRADVDTDRQTLTISGADSQIRAAEWLLAEIDRPVSSPGAQPPPSRLYRDDALGGDSIRVFYAPSARPIAELHESATIARSLLDVRYLFTYPSVRALIVRGSSEQLAAAEWLWRTLETDPPSSTAAVDEFRSALPDSERTLRAYRMPADWSPQQLQEAATLLRSVVEIRRLLTYNRTKMIFVRGTDAIVAAANWLAAETRRPPSPDFAESELFRLDDPRDESSLRVFRLPSARFDPAGLQRVATDVRRQTQIRRVLTFNSPGMIALRGTDAQVAQARSLIVTAAQ